MTNAPREKLPAIDLFSGAGGLSLGLSRAGFAAVAAAEMDTDALATYAAAHLQYSPGVPLTLLDGDIKQHSFKQWRNEIALVAGGPPCQPYSFGGLRRGKLDLRDGIPQFLRAVREIRPEAFLMENVPGLASASQRPLLNSLVLDLEELGFKVEWRVLRAADYGVCQRRQRLIIVGTRSADFAWPAPTHGPNASTPWISAASLLEAHRPIGTPNASIVTYAKNPDLRPSPWDGHLWNGGGRAINPEGLAPTLLASMGGNKTPWLDGGNVVQDYHRHLLGGGSPRSGIVEGARRITIQEAALVQTFPVDMPWFGRSSSQYRQIGNAVPVQLAQAIGHSLAESLASSSSSLAVA